MNHSHNHPVSASENQPLPAKLLLTRQMVENTLCKQKNTFWSYLGVIAGIFLSIILGAFVFPMFYLFIVNCIISLKKMISTDINRKDLQYYVIDRPCIEKKVAEHDESPDELQLWFLNKDEDLYVAVSVEKDYYDATELGEGFYLVFAAAEKLPCLWYRKKEWDLAPGDWSPL